MSRNPDIRGRQTSRLPLGFNNERAGQESCRAQIYVGFKRRRQAAVYLLLMLFFNIIYTLNFSIADIDNYLLPAVAALFLFAAFVIYELVRKPDLTPDIE
ncbi:MAG: hypothetical protein KAV87_14195 [Desulfobacteraceae bacterium]|nr:hypothetical protein [Desulfobacteraceae bacterium]